MATVRVRRDDYEDGVLPEVCVRTGGPADVLVGHRSVRGVGPWGLLLVLLGPVGIVAWIVAERLLRREAEGMLPASRAAVEASAASRRRWDALVWGGSAVAAAGLVLAVLAEGPWTTVAAVLLVGGLVAVAIAWFVPVGLQPNGIPDRDGRWIEIRGVSPAFARAYEAQDAGRAERRRAAARRDAGAPGSPVPSTRS